MHYRKILSAPLLCLFFLINLYSYSQSIYKKWNLSIGTGTGGANYKGCPSLGVHYRNWGLEITPVIMHRGIHAEYRFNPLFIREKIPLNGFLSSGVFYHDRDFYLQLFEKSFTTSLHGIRAYLGGGAELHFLRICAVRLGINIQTYWMHQKPGNVFIYGRNSPLNAEGFHWIAPQDPENIFNINLGLRIYLFQPFDL